ncbi:RAB11-binding protein RELCH homolog [Phymastichus coffea]|uniref:RAB11-binding protein RELCH homolog n=1 Tax=Phymastichus coffea TaxID=108790 RepID=UPI00273C3B67|nr:RAB11-binding protein RELCH homolog [Phymastichus coffea]
MASSSSEEVRSELSPSAQLPLKGREPAMVSYEEIAQKLLNERLLLTALELHAELCEADRELPMLRDFFSNPNNFECLNMKPEPCLSIARSSSQATLDSLDISRYSEDGGGIDERVAILEFELRKAKDNINSLRANLTVVTESEVSTPDKNSDKHPLLDHPIKPHEQRAINFLVNEYLLANSYKLTSITFSDEIENQDFEDWQDVGLNIPKPPELHQIYREFMRCTGYDKPPSCDIGVQTDDYETDKEIELSKVISEMSDEMERLKQRASVLEQEKNSLQETLNSNNLANLASNNAEQGSSGTIPTLNSSSTTPDKFEMLETPSTSQPANNVTPAVAEEDDNASMVVSIGETETSERDWTRIHLSKGDLIDGSGGTNNAPSRYLPSSFRREVLKYCQIPIPPQAFQIIDEALKEGVTRDNLPEIAAHTLPRIIPNVVLNRREELIPLILSVSRLQSTTEDKEKLLQMAFGLQKRPHEEERQMVLAGLIALAKQEKEPTDNEDVLNVCWELSQHKYPERRLLAAECCAALALYTSSGVRNSLMISMLQQMLLDDKEPEVRAAVVKSLALVVALLDDPDKYFQCEELALMAMDDISPEVTEAASTILIPILAQWALSLKRLHSHLIPRIIEKIHSLMKPTHPPGFFDGNRATILITLLRYLLPHTIIYVLDTETVRGKMQESLSSQLPQEFTNLCCLPIVTPKIFYECEVELGVLINTFLLNTWDDCTWPEIEWFCDKMIHDLAEIAMSLSISQHTTVREFLKYLQSTCMGFGRYIAQQKILPTFKPHVDFLDTEFRDMNNKLTSPALIPAYITILATIDIDEFTNALKHYLFALSIRAEELEALEIVVVNLSAQELFQEYVLSALWDGVVHPNASVKRATVAMFSAIVGQVSIRTLDIRIAPAIVTLASDTDISVKGAAVQALGKFLMESEAQEAKDKSRQCIESILRDPQGVPPALGATLVLTLATVAPYCPQNYVEEVIATQLTGITASALQQQHSRKVELTNALVEAYSVLVYCTVSNQCVTNTIHPGLKYLESLVNQIVPQQKDAVRSLLREIDSRGMAPKMDRSASMGERLSLSSVNVGQGVEDMKQRVSKMFQQKSSPGSVSGLFRKK